MNFFNKKNALFIVLLLLGFHLPTFTQNNSSTTQKSFVRAVDATDLPDFSTAIPMNWCGKNNIAGINVPPTVIPSLPAEIYPGGLYPITLTEHLQFLPNTNLQLTQYFHYNGQLLENNLCSFWQPWTFEKSGVFEMNLMWFSDTFFVIRSLNEPTCEVVIWIRPQQIPIGRAAFPRCFN